MLQKPGLTEEQHRLIADQLYEAEKTNRPIAKLTETYREINQEDAYLIQKIGLERRLRDGEVLVGRKIGLTSRGMMEMLHCDSPDYGYLLSGGMVLQGEVCDTSSLNIPLLEGEIAFIMGEDIRGPGVTPAMILNATEWVVPCFELCDGRYEDWKVTVVDTISDDAGASKFMLGSTPKRVNEVDLRCIGMVMEKNGRFLGSAAGAEVMGSPVNSVVWLVNKLAEYGDGLRRGDVVLSGAFMKADAAAAGDHYTMQVDGFPPLTFSFK